MKRRIEPVDLGLNMGAAHFIEVKVSYTLGSPAATLYIDVFDANQHKMLPSPLEVAVPSSQLQAWNYDFSPVAQYAAQGINAALILTE